tara:strand:+ start:1143 stop:2399 length:1257 start_codon:yes stop_codon:yes gene_type:complete
MAKPKILWSSDMVAKTGFARVTENLVPLLSEDFEIIILANNWWGDPTEYQQRYKLYPSSNRYQTDPFGANRIREIVEREKPDLVFVNNDCWIVNTLYEQIKDYHKAEKFKFIAYMPMDSYGWTGCIPQYTNEWDSIIVYTEFGAKEFHKGGCKKEVGVIPHGITANQFFPLDKQECRKELNMKEEDFVVFNGNRNQARKRIDITIDAFSSFAIDKPEAKLYLHMGKKDQGWDVMSLFGKEMYKKGLNPNGRIIMTTNTDNGPNVPVELLNKIYNAVDVGVNTCKGEGHGLVNHEHAACRVAQIVPDHTSMKELFNGACPLIKSCFIDVDLNYNREMPCPSAKHLTEILNLLYHDRGMLSNIAESCYKRAIDEKYQWPVIAKQFEEDFKEVLARPSTQEKETEKEEIFIPRSEREALKI